MVFADHRAVPLFDSNPNSNPSPNPSPSPNPNPSPSPNPSPNPNLSPNPNPGPEQVPFFKKHGFSDDPMLNARYAEVRTRYAVGQA